jgi:hypothetical protein
MINIFKPATHHYIYVDEELHLLVEQDGILWWTNA